jgi:hypothetical protein
MDLFSYLRGAKLNKVDEAYGTTDITKGPSPFVLGGLLGQKIKLSSTMALKLSDTTVGTLYGGEYQLVRLDPAQTATLANSKVGAPVYWVDRKLFKVTFDAVATALLAGIAISVPTAKGNVFMICTLGEVGALYANPTTKGATADANDPVVAAIAGGVAVVDILADATGWTNVQKRLEIGRAAEDPGAGNAIFKIILTNAVPAFNDGVR